MDSRTAWATGKCREGMVGDGFAGEAGENTTSNHRVQPPKGEAVTNSRGFTSSEEGARLFHT